MPEKLLKCLTKLACNKDLDIYAPTSRIYIADLFTKEIMELRRGQKSWTQGIPKFGKESKGQGPCDPLILFLLQNIVSSRVTGLKRDHPHHCCAQLHK